MKTFPELYQKDKNGTLKCWSVEVDGAVITVRHGQLGGKITPKVSPPCKGKGKGAAKTTPEGQALKEAQAKWQKQVDKCYGADKDNLPTSTAPPLAHKYNDKKHLVTYPWLGSNKLDGCRMTAFYREGEVYFQSRGQKEYPLIKDIAEELYTMFFKSCPSLIVDGELYFHTLCLEDTVSAVKKHNENTPLLEFHVFDVVDPTAEARKPFSIRQAAYNGWIASQAEAGIAIKVKAVQQRMIKDEQVMINMHDAAVRSGYEGVVLRNPDSLFVFAQRTSDFLKYKVALQEEFQVVGFEKDKNEGAVPVVITKGGKEFKANFKGTHDFRRQMWVDREKHIGRFLSVDFESWSKYDVPLKPISVAFRELCDEGLPQT